MIKKRIAPVDFDALKRQVSVSQVLRHLGWMPTRIEPATQRGPCPVHGSRSRGSRSLSVSRTWWKCWSCGARGDVIRLWALLHRCDDLTAALAICEALNVRVPRRTTP
jgi:DNA primase